VLLFGVANDLLFSAILMVAAISTGMAIAMSGIGILAIIGRRIAFRRLKDDEAKRTRFTSGLRIAGAALVLMIGTLLFGLAYSDSGQVSLPLVSSKLGEIYPYAAGSTALNAVFLEPEVWVDQLGYEYEKTVQDVATGE